MKWTLRKILSGWRNETLGGDDPNGEMSEQVLRGKELSINKTFLWK